MHKTKLPFVVDIHTHRRQFDKNELAIVNLNLLDRKQIDVDTLPYFTVGIHPWWIKNFPLEAVAHTLEHWTQHPNCVGLGEIGLDASRPDTLAMQKDYLATQLNFAKKQGINLLILHCVRLYNEAIAILNKTDYQGNIVLHDYNGSLHDTQQLLKKNQFYFSFGKRLFQKTSKAVKALPYIPLNRLLLETDDQIEYSLYDIYDKAQEILHLDSSKLHHCIFENAKTILPPLLYPKHDLDDSHS